MENFRVCFERSFELVIRAEDEGLLTAVLADMTDYDINDLAGYGGWEFTCLHSTSAADQGLLDGEIVHIDDMPTDEELLASETEDERYQREYAVGDPRQASLPIEA